MIIGGFYQLFFCYSNRYKLDLWIGILLIWKFKIFLSSALTRTPFGLMSRADDLKTLMHKKRNHLIYQRLETGLLFHHGHGCFAVYICSKLYKALSIGVQFLTFVSINGKRTFQRKFCEGKEQI
jgi:hypothetical protein